jgi:hypothetical protein
MLLSETDQPLRDRRRQWSTINQTTEEAKRIGVGTGQWPNGGRTSKKDVQLSVTNYGYMYVLSN